MIILGLFVYVYSFSDESYITFIFESSIYKKKTQNNINVYIMKYTLEFDTEPGQEITNHCISRLSDRWEHLGWARIGEEQRIVFYFGVKHE